MKEDHKNIEYIVPKHKTVHFLDTDRHLVSKYLNNLQNGDDYKMGNPHSSNTKKFF